MSEKIYNGYHREYWLRRCQLCSVPRELLSDLQKEIQAESLRPIKFVRQGTSIDVNFGTLIRLPVFLPAKHIGFTNDVYRTMELMGLIREANGQAMTGQEQLDWIKIAGKTGFRKP